MKKYYWSLLLLVVFTYWTVKPLFMTGYFSMHDDTQVARVIVMGRALRNGQFPVRWVSDLGYGYGYPLYNFYGPLPYYFGGVLYAAGMNAVVTTKAMMAVGMMLAAVTMYVLVQARFGRLSGILAGILYAFAPYHAVQLYVRGAVGELWAYALLPLLFLGIFLVSISTRRKDGIWIGGVGLAGIILSHTISGYMTVVFYLIGLALYTLILLFKRRFHFSLLTFHFSLLSVGLGLSAFFWLPAIAEMGYTNVAGQIGVTANFRDHFVCIPQLWNSLWGYGGSVSGCIDGMSFKIGKLHIMLAILGAVLGFSSVRLFVIIGIASVFMALGISRGIWDSIPGFAYVQYPWRLLTAVVFSVSVLGGSVLFWIKQRWAKIGTFAILLIAIPGLNVKLFTPQMTYDKPSDFYESSEELLWRASKVSDEYLPPSFQKPDSFQAVAREILASDSNRGLAVETEINTETYTKLHINTQVPMDVTLNRISFPGWQYWVNGVRQHVRIENGLPVTALPAGGSVVEIRFSDTLVRTIGNMLSIFAVLWFLKDYGKKSIA